jgi:four helix bundle protein
MTGNGYKGGFRDLEAWKEARVLRQMVIEDCKTFPKEERYLLVQQIKDSSRSVTANMAEGYGRYHFQETTQFFRTSRGSLNETLDHYSSALDEQYITREKYLTIERQYEKVLRLTNEYIKFLQKSKMCEPVEPTSAPSNSSNS